MSKNADDIYGVGLISDLFRPLAEMAVYERRSGGAGIGAPPLTIGVDTGDNFTASGLALNEHTSSMTEELLKQTFKARAELAERELLEQKQLLQQLQELLDATKAVSPKPPEDKEYVGIPEPLRVVEP